MISTVCLVLCHMRALHFRHLPFYFSIPNAVSSSEDPLVGDQSTTTGVIEVVATLVLQRDLRTTNNSTAQ